MIMTLVTIKPHFIICLVVRATNSPMVLISDLVSVTNPHARDKLWLAGASQRLGAVSPSALTAKYSTGGMDHGILGINKVLFSRVRATIMVGPYYPVCRSVGNTLLSLAFMAFFRITAPAQMPG